MSKARLVFSYCSIVIFLAGAGWLSQAAFPMARSAAAEARMGSQVSSQPNQVAPPPLDPSELVTSRPETLETPESRAPVVTLLRQAFFKRAFAAVRPYAVKVSFTASGQVQELGPGEMDETGNKSGTRRWTGHVGNFSLTRIITERWYDSGTPGPIPMRLAMVRSNVLGPPFPATAGSIRTVGATLNGSALTCILTSSRASTAPYRDWSEEEYCVDSQSLLLRVYSAAPGTYVVYDYSTSSAFHGHIVPGQFTVTEAGEVVLQGNISVTDPDAEALDPSLFTPTSQMLTGGVGLIGPTYQVLSSGTASGLVHPVVVHATLSPDGTVVEAESLQTSDASLSQYAMSVVKKTKYDTTTNYGYASQQEIFITVE